MTQPQSLAVELSQKASHQCIPLDVTWEITKQCNLHCTPCYVVKHSHTEISLKEGLSLIQDLCSLKTMYLSFTGGEPFLRKEDLRIWSFAAQKAGMAISIFTNGTCIAPEDIAWLKDLSPFAVHISLFAVDTQIHDSITQVPGSCDKTSHSIRTLHHAGIPVIIKTLLMRKNVHERKKIIAFAKELGVAWNIDPLVTPKETGESLNHMRLLSNDIETVYEEQAPITVPRFKANTSDEFLCGAGANIAAISSAGDVYPCLMYPVSAGNVHKQSFFSIWRTSPVFNHLRALTFKDIKQCSNCSLMAYCSRCPGLALLEDGDEKSYSSTSCMLARITRKTVEDKQGARHKAQGTRHKAQGTRHKAGGG